MARSLTARLLRRLGDRPAKLAFRLTNIRVVRQSLGRRYHAALDKHHATLPRLSGDDKKIVDGLEKHGYYITSLAALALAGSGEMLEAAQRTAEECTVSAREQARAGREFTYVPPDVIAANAEIFTWGVNERLLDIAESYVGLPVAYDGLHIIYTVADGREVATRLWHRDREDRRMVKVAVYCNDVGEGGGPLQLITRLDKTQGDAKGYRYAGGAEKELRALLGADYRQDIVTCAGAAGTVIFIDTARYFHRGEPVRTADRKAIYYSYFAKRTRHPFFCRRSGLQSRQITALADGMTPRQRASTLWHRDLPAWVKLIPSAPV